MTTQFNFGAYMPLALRTEAPLPTMLDRLEHMHLGLTTEVGEFTTEVKRMAIYGKPLDEERRKHMGEELGDVLWYLPIGLDALGLTAGMEDLVSDPIGFTTTNACLASLSRRMTGIVGELGALVESYRANGADTVDEGDYVWVARRIGAMLNLAGWAAEAIGTTLQELGDENIAKLQLSYPDKFTAEAAEARADKAGLDARNS